MHQTIFNNINKTLYTLFGFILALFSAWSWQLLPHSIIEVFDSSRKAQLIVLFLLVMFTINLFNPETPFVTIIYRSGIVYLLYLAITKQSLDSFVLMMGCLIINAIISNYIEYYNIQLEKTESPTKKVLIENKKKMLSNTLNVSLVITVAVIIHGISAYLMKQYKDHYNKKDSLIMFLLRFLFEGSKVQRKSTGTIF